MSRLRAQKWPIELVTPLTWFLFNNKGLTVIIKRFFHLRFSVLYLSTKRNFKLPIEINVQHTRSKNKEVSTKKLIRKSQNHRSKSQAVWSFDKYWPFSLMSVDTSFIIYFVDVSRCQNNTSKTILLYWKRMADLFKFGIKN